MATRYPACLWTDDQPLLRQSSEAALPLADSRLPRAAGLSPPIARAAPVRRRRDTNLPFGGQEAALGPSFDATVPPGGYIWWYVDAMSDCGRYGLTIIAFIGSVFSPYYYWSGRGNPENHIAMNVALYGPGGGWAMTERSEGKLQRDQHNLVIGPSSMRWDGDMLVIDIEEITAPIPKRLRGQIRLHPQLMPEALWPLDPAGRHAWRPIAPRATVEVKLSKPSLSWRGEGYLDSNAGVEPLESGFRDWRWSRAHVRSDSVVLYEGNRRDGSSFEMGLKFGSDGTIAPVEMPPERTLPRTLWRMERRTRADAGADVSIRKTWEDTPFYARTALTTTLLGERAEAVHESLSLDRLNSPIIKTMLPWRMPRTLI